MTRDADRSRLVLGLALLTAFGACSSDGTTDPRDDEDPRIALITTLLVSGPSSVDAASGSLVAATGEDTYAYVSAPPGSAPGVTATITNLTRYRQSGSVIRVDVSIEDRGFDPVRIAASTGDTLQVDFRAADGSLLFAGAAVVPKVRPPKIVRTNPRPGKKDVPLNARFEIVFSEPIDPGTITPENILVVTGGIRVAGSLVRTNDFTVAFVPAQSLSRQTPYQIVITAGVRSLSGVALESESSVNFETEAAPTTAAPINALFVSGIMTPQYQGVRVSSGGAPVGNAVVTVNGVRIPHCCGDLYSGDLLGAVPAGGTLNLKVVAGGVSFEASAEVIPTPVITAPAAGSTYAPTDHVDLAWTTPTDPDEFWVCLNCWENSLSGEMWPASGSAREFRIEPYTLVDFGTGAVVAVYAFKNNVLKPASSPAVTSNVVFVARSSDALITINY